jgi:hypothetical protein
MAVCMNLEKDIFVFLDHWSNYKNQPHSLFLRSSIFTCQQKLNPFDETVLLTLSPMALGPI